MISIVSPIYNEADNLVELCERTVASIEKTNEDFEFILVENGSHDRSLEIMKSLREQDHRIKYLSLSRNFGHQGGILAGIAHASGDAVISIDGDLQQPPELIPELISLWKEGYDVVYTTKELKNNEGDWRFYLRLLFYKFISLVSDIQLTYGQSDFRLLDRKVVDVLMQIPEKNMFLRGLVAWTGFKQKGIAYTADPRKKGRSKFSLKNYIKFAVDGIVSFSTVPLRMFLWAGLLISIFCTIYGSYIVAIYFLHYMGYERLVLPPGWTSIALALVFFGAIQLIGIGILGEYIGRIFHQTKHRPDYIVKEKGL